MKNLFLGRVKVLLDDYNNTITINFMDINRTITMLYDDFLYLLQECKLQADYVGGK